MVILIVSALLVSMYCIWPYLRLPKYDAGTITVAPSEGIIEIKTEFSPDSVSVYLPKRRGRGHSPDHDQQGCGRLRDYICDVRINNDGFEFRYVVETGVRDIKWKALKWPVGR